MAIKRTIDTQIWYDSLFADQMTQSEKLLWLYFLTNNHNILCGTAIIPLKIVALESGFSVKEIEIMLERFENKYNITKYNKLNNELIILNWDKYNWSKSLSVKQSLEKQIKNIKTKEFQEIVVEKINNYIWTEKSNGKG